MALGFECVNSACLSEDAIPYLTFKDLCSYEASASFSSALVQRSCAWYKVACRDIRNFDLTPEGNFDLTVGVCGKKNKEGSVNSDRRNMKIFLAALHTASSMEQVPIPLAGSRDASDMVMILQKFESTASVHRRNGGSFAKVLVGRFRFNGTPADRTRAQFKLRQMQPNIVFSEPTKTELACSYARCMQQSSLALTMALEKNRMLLSATLEDGVSATKAGEVAEGCPCNLLIDVRAISPAIILHARNINVRSDGSHYESGSGLYSQKGSRAVVEAALAAGVTCVVLVRDTPDGYIQESCIGVVANSLHLDRVGRM